jgi:hypothetical protein
MSPVEKNPPEEKKPRKKAIRKEESPRKQNPRPKGIVNLNQKIDPSQWISLVRIWRFPRFSVCLFPSQKCNGLQQRASLLESETAPVPPN